MYGTDFLLDGNAEERDGSFFCIPAARTAGRMEYGCNLDYKNNGILYCSNV